MTKDSNGKLVIKALFKHEDQRQWFCLKVESDTPQRGNHQTGMTWECSDILATPLYHESAFKWASWAYRKTGALAVTLEELWVS